MIAVKTKQPADSLDYDLGFDDSFPAGDDITAATATVAPEGELSVDAIVIAGQDVKVWVSGGVDGSSYVVTVIASSAAGRIKETEFKIRVRDY